MPRKIAGSASILAFAALIGAFASVPADAAEREQVRAVINLISAVKMPFPEQLRNNMSRTEWVTIDTNTTTIACLRLDDKQKWCYEHIAATGARAEMLRVRTEPVAGIVPGQVFQYAVDFDLDGQAASAAPPRSMASRMPRSGRWCSSFIAAPAAATSSAAISRSCSTTASRSR